MPEIRILDVQVANQIAAGEVIDRPASVIKELVENALDAGATFIQVEVDQGGRFLRVVDNGSGIPADAVQLAFQRFATSKLTDYNDVWQLNTMGFRGEALPSIASVAQVEMLTRTADTEVGQRLILHGGQLISQESAGGPVGTSLTIQDLFYNTPARLKFMGSENTEMTHIQQLMQAFALGAPEVAFRLIRKGRTSLQTHGRSDVMGVVRQILGKDLAASLFSLQHHARGASVTGALSYPDYVRKDRNQQYFFVNRRWVKVPALSKILEDLYADLVPRRHYPVAVLQLDLPPESVDINVHPSKREVKFRHFSLVYQLLREALEQSLERYHRDRIHLVEPPRVATPEPVLADPAEPLPPFAPQATASAAAAPSASVPDAAPETEASLPPWLQGASAAAPAAPEAPLPPAPESTGIYLAEPATAYSAPVRPAAQPGLGPASVVPERAPEKLSLPGFEVPPAESRSLPDLEVIGQVCENTYIVARAGRDLVLIDQHVAEERYLYEQLLDKGELARQPLLVSVIIELNALEREAAETHRELFEQAGFEFEPYGPDTLAIRSLPHCLRPSGAEHAFRTLLDDLLETGVADARTSAYRLACKTIACHSAIRAGDPLTREQMQEIVNNWTRTRNPYTCPHGRPILLKLSKDEINRRFLRTWS
ncbi:MAG: DNA mismatch repair endonuclease MutL [Candidatus Sericytochromatia bacterium]